MERHVHMALTVAFANFHGSDCNIRPFAPGNLIALSSIFFGRDGMLTDSYITEKSFSFSLKDAIPQVYLQKRIIGISGFYITAFAVR